MFQVAAEYHNPGAFYWSTTTEIPIGPGIPPIIATVIFDYSVTIVVKAMEFWVSNPVRKRATSRENLSPGFPTRSDTNRAIKP